MRLMGIFLSAMLAALMVTQFAAVALAVPVLRPSPDQERFGLGGYMEVLEDPTNTLSIEDVASREFRCEFKSVNSDHLNIGYTSSTYWIRFSVDMTGLGAETKWNIDPGWFHYDDLRVYVQRKAGQAGNSVCDGVPYELVRNKMRMYKLESEDCGNYYIKFYSIYPLYINTYIKTIDDSVWMHCV